MSFWSGHCFTASSKAAREEHRSRSGDKRLARMLAENPLRTNYQQHFEEIVAAYNAEKDRVTIETTFEALIKLVGALDEEDPRKFR